MLLVETCAGDGPPPQESWQSFRKPAVDPSTAAKPAADGRAAATCTAWISQHTQAVTYRVTVVPFWDGASKWLN